MLRNFPGPPNFVRPSLLSSVNALASSVSASVKDDTDAIVVSPFFSQKAHAANNLIRYSLDPCTASAHSCWLTTFGLVDGPVSPGSASGRGSPQDHAWPVSTRNRFWPCNNGGSRPPGLSSQYEVRGRASIGTCTGPNLRFCRLASELRNPIEHLTSNRRKVVASADGAPRGGNMLVHWERQQRDFSNVVRACATAPVQLASCTGLPAG